MATDPATSKGGIIDKAKAFASRARPRTRSQTRIHKAASISSFHIYRKSKNNDGSTQSLASSAGSDDENRKRKVHNDKSTNTTTEIPPGSTQEAVAEAVEGITELTPEPSTQVPDSQPGTPGKLTESQVIDAQVEALAAPESTESISSGDATPTAIAVELPQVDTRSPSPLPSRFGSLPPEDKEFYENIRHGHRCEENMLKSLLKHYEDAADIIRRVFDNRTKSDITEQDHRVTMNLAKKMGELFYETSERLMENQNTAQEWLFDNKYPHFTESQYHDEEPAEHMDIDTKAQAGPWDNVETTFPPETFDRAFTDAHNFHEEAAVPPQETSKPNIPGLEGNPLGEVLIAILNRLDSLEGKKPTVTQSHSHNPSHVPANPPQSHTTPPRFVPTPPKANTSGQGKGKVSMSENKTNNIPPPKASFAQAAKSAPTTPAATKGNKVPEVNASKIANTLRRSNGPSPNSKRFIVRFENATMSQPTTETIVRGLRETLNQDNFTMGEGNLTHTQWGIRGTLHLVFSQPTTQPCIERAIAAIVKRFRFPNYTYHVKEPWSKLVIKGVPTGLATDIPTTYSKDELIAELRMRLPAEHKNVKFALEPDWITNPLTLQSEQRPTGVVTFTIVDPGNNISEKLLKINNIWMFGKKCQFSKFALKPILQVCTNCAHYGHTANSCKQKKPRCNECGGFDHSTANHKAANCKGCKIHGTEKREPCECAFCPSCRKQGHKFNTPECPKLAEFRMPIVDMLNRSVMNHD